MKYNPDVHHRRSIRLTGYDYSRSGAYFVTICTQNRVCRFGEIVDGVMQMNDEGRILQAVWDGLSNHYPHVELDALVIMPNHVHGIMVLDSTPVWPAVGAGFKPALETDGNAVRAGLKPAPTTPGPTLSSAFQTTHPHGLSEIVRALKTFSSRRINEWCNMPGTTLWQRNYWERIVRDEQELNCFREYIQNNPLQWEMDKLHPDQPEFGPIAKGRAGIDSQL